MPTKALVGRKLGMTQIYREDGSCIPVTVLEAGPCTVTQVKTEEKDGYAALQVSFGSRKKRPRNATRPLLGHLIPKKEDADAQARRKQLDQAIANLKEIPETIREIPAGSAPEAKVGDVINVEILESFKKIDITARSKGRGFNSAIARWGYGRQPASHGSGNRERSPGSLSGGVQGGKTGGVVMGKKMAGHWGNETVTSRNLDISHIDKENNLLCVNGSVPGPTGGIVMIKESHWVPPKSSTVLSKKKKK